MKQRKKKKPVVPGAMRSLRKARKVTSEFHNLTAALELAKSAGKTAEASKLSSEIEELGGRQAYQEASILATSRSKHSSKWVFSELTKLDLRPKRGESPLRMLEVGAVNTQLLSVPWLSVRAIDLRSCHPRIEKADFFDLPPEQEFDVVVCSMVINCVPNPAARGEMLHRLLNHVKPCGHVFLTLPLRCLTHSEQTSWTSFTSVLQKTGFRIESSKTSPKVAFFCLVRPATSSSTPADGAKVSPRLCEPPPKAPPGKCNQSFAVKLFSPGRPGTPAKKGRLPSGTDGRS